MARETRGRRKQLIDQPQGGHMTNTRIQTGLTLLRAAVGAIFIAHGAQKLFVYGLGGVTGAFGQTGVPFHDISGPIVTLLEFFGGTALAVGLLSRPAAL